MLFQCILVSLRSEEIILSDSWWKFAMFLFYVFETLPGKSHFLSASFSGLFMAAGYF